jgi:hypothetical protein
MKRRGGWIAFGLWALAGTVTSLTLAAALSFGLFIAPLAALALWIAATKARTWPEAIGAAEGLAGILLLIAFAQRSYHPCASGGSRLGVGEYSTSCGGLSPVPFLIAGLILAVAAPAAYRRLASGMRTTGQDGAPI